MVMLFELQVPQWAFLLPTLVCLYTAQALSLFAKSPWGELSLVRAEKQSAEFGWSLQGALVLENAHLALCCLGIVLLLCTEIVGLFILLFALGGVSLGLRVYRTRRAERVDQQVESWLLQLARAMQSAPSLSDAIFMSQATTCAPLSHELKRVEESFRLGISLPVALKKMANDLGRPRMKQAVVTIKSGLVSGGDLPKLLKRTGDSMRELDRLGLVLRSKTAEGKTQALVISLSPLPMVLGVKVSEPHYFDPLLASAAGQSYLAVAVGLWLVAITLIRKILAVRL